MGLATLYRLTVYGERSRVLLWEKSEARLKTKTKKALGRKKRCSIAASLSTHSPYFHTIILCVIANEKSKCYRILKFFVNRDPMFGLLEATRRDCLSEIACWQSNLSATV